MSYLEIGGNRISVEPGDGFIGSDPASKVMVDGEGVAVRHARINATADGQVSVMIVDENTVVTINGVPLGPQPHPLLHGDKIGIGTVDLLFAEETTSGSTQYVSAVDAARLAGLAAQSGPKSSGQATGATGGRLVCLTDGREYTIESSVKLGREAGCDVVVTSKNVSRKHAEIVVTPEGYMLIDTSTNGTLVNGDRVSGQHLLARAEVIKIGEDEFRFYADVSKAPPPPPAPAPEAPAKADLDATIPQSAAPAPSPPAGAEYRLNNTMHGFKFEPPPSAPPSAPPGAEYRLNDTMHGIPSGPPPQPAPPAQQTPPPPTPAVPPVQQAPPPPPPAPPAQQAPPPPTPAAPPVQQAPPPPPPAPPVQQAPPSPPPAPPVQQAPPPPPPAPPVQQAPPPPPPAPPVQQAPPPPPPAPPVQQAPPPPPPAPPVQQAPPAPAPAPPVQKGPEILANLVIRSGTLMGQRVPIRVPIVNIGRADYNDIVLPEESVSTIHAKLQRREGMWFLIDLESTNGTFVDGEKVSDDVPLAPGAVVRFGEVKTFFEPTDDTVDAAKGSSTKMISAIKLPPTPPTGG